jgi:hypothetical protein
MISVKCPACGLVDWNVGDCTRCGTPLAGQEPPGGSEYSTEEQAEQARSLRVARVVVAVCACVVLGLSGLGVLYLAHKPAKPQWFWSFQRHEPTVAEIFAHNMEVTGGARRIAELRSFRAEGRFAFHSGEAARAAAAAGGEVTFVMHVKQPDKTGLEVEMGPPKAAVSIRRGFDGSRGWEYLERTTLTPDSTVPIRQHSSRELDGDELGRLKHSSRTTSLVRLADEYTSLKLTGREAVTWSTRGALTPSGRVLLDNELRGHEAYLVSGVNREGRNETFYFDTETGLLLRVDFEAEDEEGEVVRVECHFGDYKEVGGLKFPHRLYFKRGEEAATLTFEKYFPNEPIPDSTFEMPE